jgi:hypothetical protein
MSRDYEAQEIVVECSELFSVRHRASSETDLLRHRILRKLGVFPDTAASNTFGSAGWPERQRIRRRARQHFGRGARAGAWCGLFVQMCRQHDMIFWQVRKSVYQTSLRSVTVSPTQADQQLHPRAAFPATFAEVLDVSCALDPSCEPAHTSALTGLWLRSTLSAGRLLATVQAAQSSARVRAAYVPSAPLLAADVLTAARGIEALLEASDGVLQHATAPRRRERDALAALAEAAESGNWDCEAAETLVALQRSWEQGALAVDSDAGEAAMGPSRAVRPPQWLQNVGAQANALTHGLQQQLSFMGRRSGTADSASDSGSGGKGASLWPEGAGQGQKAQAWLQGPYSDHERDLFLEQARLLCFRAPVNVRKVLAAASGASSKACNDSIYVPRGLKQLLDTSTWQAWCFLHCAAQSASQGHHYNLIVQAHLLLDEATRAAEALRAALLTSDSPPPSPTAAPSPRTTASPSTPDGAAGAPVDTELGAEPRPSAAAREAALLLAHLLQEVLELGVKEDWLHVLAARPPAREVAAATAAAVQSPVPTAAAMLQVRPRLPSVHALALTGNRQICSPSIAVRAPKQQSVSKLSV